MTGVGSDHNLIYPLVLRKNTLRNFLGTCGGRRHVRGATHRAAAPHTWYIRVLVQVHTRQTLCISPFFCCLRLSLFYPRPLPSPARGYYSRASHAFDRYPYPCPSLYPCPDHRRCHRHRHRARRLFDPSRSLGRPCRDHVLPPVCCRDRPDCCTDLFLLAP